MRIIRGKYKGKRINPPKGFKSRPTTDYAKESIFNIIENTLNINELKVLDLFSGSGNISLEFLSRGCKELTAVEIKRNYSFHIKKLFEELFPENSEVITGDVFNYIKKNILHYDLIFADPPFEHNLILELPDLILNNKSLIESALIIIEHPANVDFKHHSAFKDTRRYGNVNFSFFRKR